MFNPEALKALILRSGVSHKEGAVSFIFTCPRCSKLQKLYIRKNDGKFVCFKCASDGFHGKAEYALHELLSLPVKEIKRILYGEGPANHVTNLDFKLSNAWNPSEDDGYGIEELEDELPLVQWNPEFVGPESNSFAKGYEYLTQKRGLTDVHIKEYNLKYHPAWKCVVFPVIADGHLLGWQERAVDRDFKYTLVNFKKERVLMFQDRLIGSSHAVLMEGPVDGLKAHRCGGNVVSMGKGVSEFQLEIIKSKVRKVYLGLDPDATTELDKICRSLYDEVEVYLMPPAKGRKDHGESTEEEVYEQFRTAKRYSGQMFLYFKR